MNIPEILVANGTGALLVIYMFLLRVCTSETDKYRAKLYDAMLFHNIDSTNHRNTELFIGWSHVLRLSLPFVFNEYNLCFGNGSCGLHLVLICGLSYFPKLKTLKEKTYSIGNSRSFG